MNISGKKNVGGIVGFTGDVNENGFTSKANGTFSNLVNTGTISSTGGSYGGSDSKASNAGGLIGFMEHGTLNGASYNLGGVTGDMNNVGGLVGYARGDSTIGNSDSEDGILYNQLNVTGMYNVGGIVGNAENTTVQNVANAGHIKATGIVTEKYKYHSNKDDKNKATIVEVDVDVANVGGIAGNANKVTIDGVLNTGDVSSNKADKNDFYDAGNVGGIVGKALDTSVKDALNKENDIRGSHNVGGIAGYFGSSDNSINLATPSYKIEGAINSGGDIMATGARHGGSFVIEHVRFGTSGAEDVIFGNAGGIVGYMDGDHVYITGSGNRGTVHSLDIKDPTKVSQASQAANTGGIVGKIDRQTTESIASIKDEYTKAAVSNSYNTGDVRGYLGVGGVIGMMYNGEAAGVYNLGTVNTTREAAENSKYPSVNMGGVIGDTTEETSAKAAIYDVYNAGRIGDPNYQFGARHVGGVVGRLSGDIEKAYNTGEIYNSYNVVGGIAGWVYDGSIENSFNTGNITVIDNDTSDGVGAGSQVGGIAGAIYGVQDITISNVYNLGVLRSFQNPNTKSAMGGIVGHVQGSGGTVSLSKAYTTGHLYAAKLNTNNNTFESVTDGIGSIYGTAGSKISGLTNVYYIKPAPKSGFSAVTGQANKDIEFADRYNVKSYSYTYRDAHFPWREHEEKLSFSSDNGSTSGDVNDGEWRIYEGTSMPILNAFLPEAEKFFGASEANRQGITNIQYGTAYNPLLTIINTDNVTTNLTYSWSELGAKNNASFAVYGGGLTINDFSANYEGGYFGGLLYADGALTITSDDNNPDTNNDIALGSGSALYGSSVTINTAGKLTSYGDIVATGNNTKNDSADTASVNINAKDGVDIYGYVGAAQQGKTVTVDDINYALNIDSSSDIVNDPYKAVMKIGRRFSKTTNASTKDGSVNITSENGDVNLYYGNMAEGEINAGGDVNVTANNGNVYIDSDLDLGGNLNLNAKDEALLNLTNIGRVEAKYFIDLVESALRSKELKDENSITDALVEEITEALNAEPYYKGQFDEKDVSFILKTYIKNGKSISALEERITVRILNEFMDKMQNGKNQSINMNAADAKLTVDMWDADAKKFNLDQYDSEIANDKKFKEKIAGLNFNVNNKESNAAAHTYIEVNNIEQLAAISKIEQNATDTPLNYNYAVMGDIDANGYKDFEGIATDPNQQYIGTFDGRGNRVIGLEASNGLFGTIGEDGVVKNLSIYSSNITSDTNGLAGAVAAENKGTIENVTGFGNTISGTVAAGGLVGKNYGTINDSTNMSVVKANSGTATAGGIAGINDASGKIENTISDSAVVSSVSTIGGLGGIVGNNKGTITNVDSEGVTSGQQVVVDADDSGNNDVTTPISSDDIGGIAGINNGTINQAYNEGVLNGANNVGGIVGSNIGMGSLTDVSNAADISAEIENKDTRYTGGLVGINSGSVTNGRNNGYIVGNSYVGGLVGQNAKDSTLENLVNDSSATIVGNSYVGGIAGGNLGTITAENQDDLINRGEIYGNKYVGGVAGSNAGTITNVNTDVRLNVKGDDARYFGGVVGENIQTGTIINATNEADINAKDASYVGGIVGKNDGKLEGMNGNKGNVSGGSFVGGIVGQNNVDISGVTATNEGKVTAAKGGAGGIFGAHDGKIENSTLTNKGTVTGTGNDGTGGIANTNSGKITNSTLINEGVVQNTKGDYVGGIFGKKTGAAISDSTLVNNGQVSGNNKVGGIFGFNESAIDTSTLANSDKGQVSGNDDVCGLIGSNSGNITGGRDDKDNYYKYQIYNNGAINANKGNNVGGLFGQNSGDITAAYNTGAVTGGNNVGGIAGVNTGSVDQVFNSIVNNGLISGASNVGAIIGDNSNGAVANAYTTTNVKGNADGKALVGTGNAVGFNDAVWNSYGDGKVEGNNKLLSVFLTKLTFEENKNIDKIIYNAGKQVVSIKEITGADGKITLQVAVGNTVIGTLTAAGNDADAAHSLQDYLDANALLKPNENAQNAGEHLLYGTKQIDGHNNLGFDIADFKFNIKKATIDLILNDVERVYGNATITKGNYGYGFGANVNEAMKNELSGGITMTDRFDEAVDNLAAGKTTNDAGDHSWGGTFTLSGELAKNYQFDNKGNSSKLFERVSKVGKAQLAINVDNASTEYGTKFDESKYSHVISGLVNGDSETVLGEIVYKNDAAFDGSNGKWTDNAGTHTNAIGFNDKTVENLKNLKNYDVTVNNGNAFIDKKTINIVLKDKVHIYGDKETFDHVINDKIGWVNGDKYSNDDVTLNVNDGAYTDGKTNDVGDYKVTGSAAGAGANASTIDNNYKFEVSGNSKVEQKELSLNDFVANIVYGTKGDKFTVGNVNLKEGGLVYGDKVTVGGDAKYDVVVGSEYDTNRGGRDTADASDKAYADSLQVSGLTLVGDKAKNYKLSDTSMLGDIKVDKAQLNIKVDDSTMELGSKPTYSGTLDKLVNGDRFTGGFGISDSKYEGQVGTHVGEIGIVIDGKVYTVGTGDWTQGGFWKNYNITLVAGALTVTAPVDPDKPGVENWNFWEAEDKYAWGKNRAERERKAEINFVNGGMQI